MRKKRALSIEILLAFILFFIGTGHTAMINANSCSQSDVQVAIGAAQPGDIVSVPAGQCTWTSKVFIPQGVTLRGSGIDLSVITANMRRAAVVLRSDARLTGFSFNLVGDSYGPAPRGTGWRVDHCKFESKTIRTGVYPAGDGSYHPSGLVDNCEFINTRVLVMGQANTQYTLWDQPSVIGTADAVYVEDSTFTFSVFGNAIDANRAGRYVFRHNTVTDSSVDCHSLQGDHRATRSWEIYNNQINQVNRAMWVPFFIRGGTGVVFNNILTGTWSKERITIDNVRSFTTKHMSGRCNGSSVWDGNEAVTNGTGTHNGADNATTLTDLGQSWTENAFVYTVANGTGVHTGADDASILTDSSKSWSTKSVGGLKGFYIYNNTDGSGGIITATTATTITAILAGGTDNNLDNGDKYIITNGIYVYNITDGSKGQITANNGTTVMAVLLGGTDNDWDSGDKYKITNGYPCRDQIGRSTDVYLWTDATPYPPQMREPAYEWNNTGASGDIDFGVVNRCNDWITEGIDYYNDTKKPGYTPFTYPHPLQRPKAPQKLRITQ